MLPPRLGGPLSEEQEEAQDDLHDAARNISEAFVTFRAGGKKHRNAQITQSFARALHSQKPEFMAVLETEAGADMRSIWTPTDTNCFKRLTGVQLDALYMDLLDLAADTALFKAFAKSKKGEKVTAMHKLFHDPEHQALRGVTPDQKTRIDAWVPNCV